MSPRRNPLTDELPPEAKAELAAVFAEMKKLDEGWVPARVVRRRQQFWERTGS